MTGVSSQGELQNPAYRSSAFFISKEVKQIIQFLRIGIWRITQGDVSPLRYLFVNVLKKVLLAVRFFTAKRVMTRASALTYSTLLAIVPICAVVFAIARGFGYNKYIEMWFRDLLSTQPQVAETIIGFVNSYLVHTKSGIFLGIGLLFMLYTVLMLVSNIEDAFNEIWQVKKGRSVFRTFTDYLAMFFVAPILIVLSSGISIYLATVANGMADFQMLSSAVRWLIDLSPYALMSLIFIALYVFMPNTRVKLSSVIIPGILAGIAMQGLQFVYIHSQIILSSYNAIYGSFAALPLFMLWTQISWTICLFGAELCYTNQNLDYYDYDANAGEISHRYKILLCSLLMSRICKRFFNGNKPYTLLELREDTTIPIRFVTDLIYELIDAGLLIEITNDEKGEESRFVPAMDIQNLTLGTMIDRLESRGQWKIDLDISKHFTERWAEALEMRSNYLKDSRNILLQDL